MRKACSQSELEGRENCCMDILLQSMSWTACITVALAFLRFLAAAAFLRFWATVLPSNLLLPDSCESFTLLDLPFWTRIGVEETSSSFLFFFFLFGSEGAAVVEVSSPGRAGPMNASA